MKVVNTNNIYAIYNNCLKTYDKLPAKTYIIKFSQTQGFYLAEYNELEIKEETIYGEHIAKVKKVMLSYRMVSRNLGIILSGDKGIGKSLFARILVKEAIALDYPVIIVDKYMPGIASFIEQIDQECVLLFDEFDKTFGMSPADGDISPQATMLSLFDGITPGKKMFVITCNELHKLNDYLLNRPGRFHYHFRFKYPTEEEVTIYLKDKLNPSYYDQIERVVLFSKKINLNFDCLRAIAFELNLGGKFEEIIKDLNIINTEQVRYDIVVHFTNGLTLERSHYYMDMFDQYEKIALYDSFGVNLLDVEFNPTKCTFDVVKGNILKGEDIKIRIDGCVGEEEDGYDYVKNLVPEYMTIKKCRAKEYHYAV